MKFGDKKLPINRLPQYSIHYSTLHYRDEVEQIADARGQRERAGHGEMEEEGPNVL